MRDKLQQEITIALRLANARLPWRTDDDAILYDVTGEEVGYIVHMPDAETARVIAICVVNAVNVCHGFAAIEIPQDLLARLARPPAPDGDGGDAVGTQSEVQHERPAADVVAGHLDEGGGP